MKTLVRVTAVLGAALAFTACRDILDVPNLQNPDIRRVNSSPATIESNIASGYQQCRNRAVADNLIQQLQTESFETASSLNNFNQGPVSAIPRAPILNVKGNQTLGDAWFNTWSAASRASANALASLDALIKQGQTTGSAAQDLRARAWAFLDMACDLGYLSLVFDSSAIVSHLMSSDSVPPLSGYKDVNAAALRYLDSAVAIANNAAAAAAFPTPTTWMSGTALSKDQFVRFARSWKARLRAEVARSKAERDAVDWNAVIADATNGLTADVTVAVGGATGWNFGWQGNQAYVDGTWHQLTYMILGQADVSGQWDAWLTLGKDSRVPFLLQTPDLRWPQGADRAAQRAAPAPGNYTNKPYIRNLAADAPGTPWGISQYQWQRFLYYRTGGSSGTVPEFLKAEVDLLAAEGYIRTGNIAAAAAKIDLSRVANGGLPALTGAVTTATQLIPGGANCVPKIPVAPNYTTTQCADIFEAMKYEKRMELGMQRLGGWYFDSRGWQNLYENTTVQYPLALSEMDARYGAVASSLYYNVGGGGVYSAPKSAYGWFELR